MTATDESLFRGAARTAAATGVPVSIRFGADAVHDLGVVLDEGLPPTASSSAAWTAATPSPPAPRSRSPRAAPAWPSTTSAATTTPT